MSTRSQEFAQAIVGHAACGGELGVVEASGAGVTKLRCGRCGLTVEHRSGVLDAEDLSATSAGPDPVLLQAISKAGLAEPAPEAAVVEDLDAEPRDTHQSEVEAPPGETEDQPVADEGGPSGTPESRPQARPKTRPTGPVRPGRLRRRWPAAAAIGAVGLLVAGALLLAGSDESDVDTGAAPAVPAPATDEPAEPSGADGSAEAPTATREIFGPISAKLPVGWSSEDVEGGGIRFVADAGGAAVLVREAASRGASLRELAVDAEQFLVRVTDDVVIEERKVGPERATTIASYDEGVLNATIRSADGRALFAIADQPSADPDEVQQQALTIAQSVRFSGAG